MNAVSEIGRVGPDRFALVIGAMKSGTTSLFEVLSQHPQIAACSEKEPNFFAFGEAWSRGWKWYAGLWAWDAARHRIALEASPSYTTYPARPGVPERIASIPGADFRFIYIMRHPCDQIESNIRHTLYAGWGTSLDEAGVPEWMIETASYAMQLDRFHALFPLDRFLLLTLDEFERDPAGVLRRVCSFLGVDEQFAYERVDERYNSGAVYEMPAVWARIAKSPLARWAARRVLPRGLKHRIRAQLARLPGRAAPLGRYRLNEDERAAVMERLDADLARLESYYGVPAGSLWGRTARVPAGL